MSFAKYKAPARVSEAFNDPGSWGMLHRVAEPTARPKLRITYLIGDALRTSNITQGFSPLLHRVVEATDEDRPIEETLESVEAGANGGLHVEAAVEAQRMQRPER